MDFTTVRKPITDSGASISTEAADEIFRPFMRGVPGMGPESGLELAICKLIAEGHGGKVGVRQSENETTIFWFSLPVSSVVADDDP